MSNRFSIFFSPSIKKMLTAFAVICIVISGIIWSVWWKSKSNIVHQEFQELFVNTALKLAKFDPDFSPTQSERIPMLHSQPDNAVSKADTVVLSSSVPFDTAYYLFLWERFISEYGLDELDSLAIDSMIKAEMLKTDRDTVIGPPVDSYTIKKDQLIKVRVLKPEILVKDTASSHTPLINTNTQYTVEFWKSPLNYRGIKSIGNLIIVYGIDDIDAVKLGVSGANFDLFLETNKVRYRVLRDGNMYSFSQLIMKEQ